jgi:hypothetical protein
LLPLGPRLHCRPEPHDCSRGVHERNLGIRRLYRARQEYTAAARTGSRTGRSLHGKVQNSVETQDKGSRVLERYAFHEKSLIKEQPRGVLKDGIIGTCEQFLDDLVIRINLKRRQKRRNVFLPIARSICCIFMEGSSSSETMQEGLSASRTEARTA